MEKMKIKLTGTSALLMHSDRLANPLDPLKKEMSTYTSKRKKTDEDHETIARLEWQASMYHAEETGPYLPGRMLKACLIGSAKKTKEGPKVKTGLIVMTDKAALEYTGPRDKEKMWKTGKYMDNRSVVVQRSRVMRCRPVFPEWSASFEIIFDPAIIDKTDILRIASTAGLVVGVGDYRPENGGDFGRFQAEEVV